MRQIINGELIEMTREEIAAFEASRIPPAPEMVTLYQGRVALRRAGLFDAIKELVSQPGNEEAFEAFEYANHWHRKAAWISALSKHVGLTDAQIDDLFRVASEIE